jgi:hypothetical protein
MHTQEEIENSKIEMAECLKRLYKNRDFKKIILDGFLEQGSTYLTKNITKVKPEYKDAVIEEMTARSIAWKYLDSIEEEAQSILDARAE